MLSEILLKMAAKCKSGTYEGEICLWPEGSNPGYPVTKGGKLNAGRVRNAAARGAQQGDLAHLKRNGLCRYMARLGIESDVCNTKGNGSSSSASASMNDKIKSASYYGIKP